MTKLHQVSELGQQIWLDNLSRSLLISGELQKYLDLGVSGITSNPFIFFHSIKNDTLYSDDIAWLKRQQLTSKERYEQLAIADIQSACDVCLPLYQESGADKGYVSLEVAPKLAHDVEGTVTEAKRLWEEVGRPNLMIKVPGTTAGIMAITELIYLGVNVNVTLLFSREQTLATLEAYLTGLKLRFEQGTAIDHIRLVASFFVSRIDSSVDDMIPESMKGKTAIALAKTIYADCSKFCQQPLLSRLHQHGAKLPSILWASTSTKNHAYSDVLYVDNLIGQNTVNTLTEKTLQVFLEHGAVCETLHQDIDGALAILAQVEEAGISFQELAGKLQEEGLKQFESAFSALLELLE